MSITSLDSDERHLDAQDPADSRPEIQPDLPAAQPTIVGDRLVYRTEDLFHDRREVWFEHGNEQYRLRITAAGKLILTK